MGVITTADEAIKEAGNAVTNAIDELNKIVIQECHGFDEFGDERRDEIEEVYIALVRLRLKLRP